MQVYGLERSHFYTYVKPIIHNRYKQVFVQEKPAKEFDSRTVQLVTKLAVTEKQLHEMQADAQTDHSLQVKHFVLSGLPHRDKLPQDVLPYYSVK